MATNPYLQDASQAVTNQVTNNLQQRILPGINMGASVNGNFGSNRHMIAQGQAIGDTNMGLSNALSNMNLQAWESGQNRSLQGAMQQAALDQQMQLAKMQDATQRDLAGNQLDFNYWSGGNQFGLQNKSLDQGFFNANRGMDLQQMQLGSNLFNQGNLGLSNAGQGLFGIGQQQMQNSWQPFQNYGQLLGQFSGLNQSTTQSQPGASTVGSALGGALTAAQLWQLLSGGK